MKCKLIQKLLFTLILTLSAHAFSKITSFEDLQRSFSFSLSDNHFNLKKTEMKALEAKLDSAITEDPALISNAQDIALDVAESYLNAGRVQEAIWALERGGLHAYSDYLATSVEKYLSEMPLTLGEPIGRGVSEAFFGKVNNILDVVVKPKDQKNSVQSEIWSYKLDRLLGFNLTPIAVKRQINGINHSIHLRVLGAEGSMLNFRDEGYIRKYSDIYLFDYLLKNADRHRNNSMFAPNGKLFAIDHGRVYGTYSITSNQKLIAFDKTFTPNNLLLNNIKNLDVAQLRLYMSQYASSIVVDFISKRFEEIKAALPDPKVLLTSRNKASMVELSENGLRFLERVQRTEFNAALGSDALLLKSLIQNYYKGQYTPRDFSLLYAELLNRPVSSSFISMSRTELNKIPALQSFFMDEQSKKLKWIQRNSSEQFAENFKSILNIAPQALSCRRALVAAM